MVVAILAIVLQGVAIFSIGQLFSGDAVPLLEGQCGFPNVQNNFTLTDLPETFGDPQVRNSSAVLLHMAPLLERAARQFTTSCTDSGSSVTCLGLDSRSSGFSWEVFESESRYCWFGDENCEIFPKSKSILQRATITADDLGTTHRDSKLAVTFISECSHINATTRFKTVPVLGQQTYLYDFGTVNIPGFDTLVNFSFPGIQDEINATFTVLDGERYSDDYKISTRRFSSSESDSVGWIPADFLLSSLNSSSFIHQEPGPHALTLIANRLISVMAEYPNDDPFYLTEPNPTPLLRNVSVYVYGRYLATLACRDQVRLSIRATNQSSHQSRRHYRNRTDFAGHIFVVQHVFKFYGASLGCQSLR
jgi:hypothetical protein